MESKFKIGDRFVQKNSRDTSVLKIASIEYGHIEPVYKLICNNNYNNSIKFGEAALEELYNKIGKK